MRTAVAAVVAAGVLVPAQVANAQEASAATITMTSDPGDPVGQGRDHQTGHRHAWVFNGHLAGIGVAETRPSQPGWVLTGQADGFVNGAATLPAANLGWRPAFEADRGDAEGTTVLGAGIPSRLADPLSRGLGEAAAIATGGGLGTVRLGADLELRMPDTSPTGHYTSVLTLTLISP
jgi:hypothetical protein